MYIYKSSKLISVLTTWVIFRVGCTVVIRLMKLPNSCSSPDRKIILKEKQFLCKVNFNYTWEENNSGEWKHTCHYLVGRLDRYWLSRYCGWEKFVWQMLPLYFYYWFTVTVITKNCGVGLHFVKQTVEDSCGSNSEVSWVKDMGMF